MAKKKKNADIEDIDAKEKKGKVLSILIALAIVAIWLFVFALLIKLDVGGFGSNVLAPILEDVPIISKILPADKNADVQGISYKNMDEAIARINELELQMQSMSTSGVANTDYITELETENARLKVFEENQKEFEKRVLDFDKNVVFASEAPDIEEYKNYYEQINPDNAALLYQQVVEQLQVDENTQEQAKRFAKMDAASAAKILEVMTGDLDLVSNILSCMKPDQSAPILEAMSAEYAAKITKKMTLIAQEK